MKKKYNESFRDYAQRWRTVATQVQPPLIEIKITMLFLSTLQELYYDRLMPMATGSFANMVKAGNLIDHAIKNGRIDTQKSSFRPKRSNFLKKKKGETQALYQQNQPNQSQRYISYQNPRTTNRITQLRVIKPLLWFFTTAVSITRYKLYKHAYLSQTVNQALHGLTILQITSPIIPDPQKQQDFQ